MKIKTISTILALNLFYFCVGGTAVLTEMESGRFDGYVKNETLGEIADLLEKQFGIEISGQEGILADRVTLSFNNLSFDDVLKRIFSKYNVIFTYDSNGKIAEIKLVESKSKTKSTATQITTPQTETDNAIKDEINSYRSISASPLQNQSDPNVPVEDEITSFKPVKVDSVGEEKPIDGGADISTFKPVHNAPPPE